MSEQSIASGKRMLTSISVSLLAAGVILVCVVLPAEYGIDPTGIGARMGIAGMSTAVDEDEAAVVDVAAAPQVESQAAQPVAETISESSAVWKHEASYRSDELSLTLAPNEGAEVKALMRTGERLVFSWEATGLVNFDMHGEVAGAKSNEFTSYWKGRQEQSGHGAFTAPFDGTHGWYWRNRGVKPVTVTVKTSGFYEKLYKP